MAPDRVSAGARGVVRNASSPHRRPVATGGHADPASLSAPSTVSDEVDRPTLALAGGADAVGPRAPAPRWLARVSRSEYLFASLVMAALVVAFFYPVLRYDGTFSSVGNLQRHMYPWMDPGIPEADIPNGFAQADQAEFVQPRQVFLEHALKQDHQLPLWDPLAFAGHPFFAANGSRLAYPPFLVLSLAFNVTWAQDLYVMLHMFVAGVAMFALLKSFGARFGGAMLAGVSWALSSYVTAWALFGSIPAVAALLPVAVLLVRRWHDRRSWRHLMTASVVLGLLFLGTSAELAFLSFLFVSGYAACLALWRVAGDWPTTGAAMRLGVLAAPALLIGAALLVGAVGVLPFLDLSRQSTRIASPYALLVQAWPTQLSYFLRAFAPPDTPLSVATLVSQQVFVGTATAVLGVVGFFLRRRGAALARGLLVVMALYLVRTPVTWAAYHLIPGLKGLNGFGRSLFLWDFGLAIAGGLGLDAVLHALRHQPRLFGSSGLGGDRSVIPRPWSDRWTSIGSRLVPRPADRRRAICALIATACIVATAAQLIWYGRNVNPPFQPRDSQFLYPETPATEAVHAELDRSPGGGRMLPVYRIGAPARPDLFARALPGATGTALGLAVAGGYETVLPPRVLALWKVIEGSSAEVALAPSSGSYYTRYVLGSVRTDLLARVGVSAVVTPPDVPDAASLTPDEISAGHLQRVYAGTDASVYRVTNALPRAFVTSDVSLQPTPGDALRRFADPTFDAGSQVILEGRSVSAPGPVGGGVPAPAVVQWQQSTPNRLQLSVSASRPGWLVVLDSWDAGWQATVAGKHVAVRRADFNFRAVPVPAGTSTVTFTYRPRPVLVGAAVSSIATVGIGLFLFWRPAGGRGPAQRRRKTVTMAR